MLAPYTPAWALAFERERDLLTSALGDALLDVHHIGSTSIVGLAAKPVIDMLLVAQSTEVLDAHHDAFIALGYQVMGEFGIPGRRYFRKDNAAGVRTHQIHAFAVGADEIRRHLVFRDSLREHPDVAAAYESLKHMLARECNGDMRCYSDGKTAFIREIEQRTGTKHIIAPS